MVFCKLKRFGLILSFIQAEYKTTKKAENSVSKQQLILNMINTKLTKLTKRLSNESAFTNTSLAIHFARLFSKFSRRFAHRLLVNLLLTGFFYGS